jgi:hypothetical protein
MISVSKAVVLEQPATPAAVKAAGRSRFALLLIVNDVLHTDKFHQRSTAKNGVFGKESMAFVPELAELVAAYIIEKESQAEKKLRAMINFWAVNRLVSAEDFKVLRDRADEAVLVAQGVAPIRRRNYLLPEYHGDRNAPWNDLPAAYMLEPMIKNPNQPINPNRIKVAKLDKKPVTPHVRKLLDNFFENIDLKYVPTGDNPTGETKKYRLWLDPMGQLVKQDKETKETNTVCNGYGWSMKLCQDMQKDGVPETIRKARAEAQREMEMEAMRPAPQQRKSDRRFSPSPRRRPSFPDADYGRDRGRRSRSRSRHSSRSSYDSRQDSRSKGRNRSRSRNQSSSRRQGRDSDDHGRRYNDRERDQGRPPSRPHDKEPSGPGQQWSGPPGRNAPNNNSYPPPPQNFGQGFAPPPPPPFGASPFPPPPPPPMPNQFPGQFPMQSFPPGPPPPPPHFQPGPYPGGVPPPPPSYSDVYPPLPPNVVAMVQQAYQFGNPFGANPPGNNVGNGQNQGYGQPPSNFQGGRGGFRGNFQGGGNNRGGYGGQQRGQRGGRW